MKKKIKNISRAIPLAVALGVILITAALAVPSAQAQPPAVRYVAKSQQEYDAIPPGELFLDPDDGKIYRKSGGRTPDIEYAAIPKSERFIAALKEFAATAPDCPVFDCHECRAARIQAEDKVSSISHDLSQDRTPLGKVAFAWGFAMVAKSIHFSYFPCDSNNETSEGLLSGRRITKEEDRRKLVAAMRFLADSIRASHFGLDSVAKNIEDQYGSYHIRIDEAEATMWFGPRPPEAGKQRNSLPKTEHKR